LASELDSAVFDYVNYHTIDGPAIVYYMKSSDPEFYLMMMGHLERDRIQCESVFRIQERIQGIISKELNLFVKEHSLDENFKTQVISNIVRDYKFKFSGNKNYYDSVKKLSDNAKEGLSTDVVKNKAHELRVEAYRKSVRNQLSRMIPDIEESELSERDIIEMIMELRIEKIHEE